MGHHGIGWRAKAGSYVATQPENRGLSPISFFMARVTSVTLRRTPKVTTPLGVFSYAHLPGALYSLGICQDEDASGMFYLMATPVKALCDKVLQTRHLPSTSVAGITTYLLDDLRVDPDALRGIDLSVIGRCAQLNYKEAHLQVLQKALEALQ